MTLNEIHAILSEATEPANMQRLTRQSFAMIQHALDELAKIALEADAKAKEDARPTATE